MRSDFGKTSLKDYKASSWNLPLLSAKVFVISAGQGRVRSALNFLFRPTVQWEVLPKPMFRFRQKVSDLDFHTFTSGGSGVSWCHICSVVLVRLLIMHFFVNPTKQWQSDFVQYFLMYESSKTQTYAKMIIEILF